jgi:membrane protein DedA with SNARE-associated domain
MDLKFFVLYTALGASVWNAILLFLWYFIWSNLELVHKYLKFVFLLIFVVIILSFLLIFKKVKHK